MATIPSRRRLADIIGPCTYAQCDETATKIRAFSQGTPIVFVGPYCDEHAELIEKEMGGLPVTGPAIAKNLQPIAGVKG